MRRINVFDINGKQIGNLVNHSQEAGTYTIEFDGKNLSGGVYFYRIVINGFSDIKKMVLLK